MANLSHITAVEAQSAEDSNSVPLSERQARASRAFAESVEKSTVVTGHTDMLKSTLRFQLDQLSARSEMLQAEINRLSAELTDCSTAHDAVSRVLSALD